MFAVYFLGISCGAVRIQILYSWCSGQAGAAVPHGYLHHEVITALAGRGYITCTLYVQGSGYVYPASVSATTWQSPSPVHDDSAGLL